MARSQAWWTALLPPGLRPADPLGSGVWQRAAHGVARPCDRLVAVVDALPAGGVRQELEHVADRAAAVRDAARAEAVRAQAGAPSSSYEVPGGEWLAVHRRLTRTATACAQAVEAVAMARVCLAADDEDGALARAAAAQRAVADAEDLLAGRR